MDSIEQRRLDDSMTFVQQRRLYEGLPSLLKVPFAWVPFAVLAGKRYRSTLRETARLDAASRDDVLAYQERALGEMLRFACDQVPAYQQFRAAVERLRPFDALKTFPFLDKKSLQEDLSRYVPRDIERLPHWECTTAGTSGNQLRIYLDDHSHAEEMAFMHHQWARVGYRPWCRKATFRGVLFPNLRPGQYWQSNPVYHEIQFSPFHMGEQTLGAYVDQLRRFRPHFMHGYPSAIALLADFVNRHGIDLSGLSLKALLLASEALLPGQRDAMQAAFGCRVFSWYGHSERLLLAGECEHTSVYHHFPNYGILEIVDEDGNLVREDGGRGELVGTALLNHSLPLIRYRTEDFARWRSHQCECGRNFDRFDEVEGRWKQEYLIGKNGARISLSALNLHEPLFNEVIRYQYYQDTPGVAEVRLLATGRFSQADASALRHAFLRRAGTELTIILRIVDDIPLTVRGKLRRLIQEIPTEPAP